MSETTAKAVLFSADADALDHRCFEFTTLHHRIEPEVVHVFIDAIRPDGASQHALTFDLDTDQARALAHAILAECDSSPDLQESL